jgi:hypothetical protein
MSTVQPPPPPNPQKLGNEERSSILPVLPPVDDFIGPDYSYADELPLPDQVGVRRGNSLGAVMDSVRGIAFYGDQIGYGQASNFLSRGARIQPFPMGINYFLRTPTKCSNGADMWQYINGIPAGTALGKRVSEAMRRLGMPALRGLAPGMVEDAKDGLDPSPIINAVLGSGYAKCKEVTMPVGDHFGRLSGLEGKEWIRPLFPGDIKYVNGKPTQTRWIFDKWITLDEYNNEFDSRVLCPDGSKIANHTDQNCDKPLLKAEGWQDYSSSANQSSTVLLPTAILLALAAAMYLRFKDV